MCTRNDKLMIRINPNQTRIKNQPCSILHQNRMLPLKPARPSGKTARLSGLNYQLLEVCGFGPRSRHGAAHMRLVRAHAVAP